MNNIMPCDEKLTHTRTHTREKRTQGKILAKFKFFSVDSAAFKHPFYHRVLVLLFFFLLAIRPSHFADPGTRLIHQISFFVLTGNRQYLQLKKQLHCG